MRQATLLAATIPTILPLLDRQYGRVLDLGCGTNRTLCELALDPHAVRVGLDRDAVSMRAARRNVQMIVYVTADAHALPFDSGSFDLVISKVALPYTNIPRVLREIHRVLGAGGLLWMTLHPLRMAVMHLYQELRAGRLGNAAYRMYVIANGVLLDVLGIAFAYPLRPSRIESFQSVRGIARLLGRAGFGDVCWEQRTRGPGFEADDRRFGGVFAVAARKEPVNATRARPDPGPVPGMATR